MKKNKIGLLGGTFNPVHCGHVVLGLKVLEAFDLDQIFYILSANPPHKCERDMAAASIRWQMLNQALSPFPPLIPCDIEMNRDTYSWTWQTVQELKSTLPEDELYFIAGSEGFLKIKTWKNYKYILEACTFIVVSREEDQRFRVEQFLKDEGITLRQRGNDSRPLPGIYYYSYSAAELSISSTKIRGNIKHSKPVNDLMDKEVIKIMEEYKLYEG